MYIQWRTWLRVKGLGGGGGGRHSNKMIKLLLIVYFQGPKSYQSIFLFLNSVSIM